MKNKAMSLLSAAEVQKMISEALPLALETQFSVVEINETGAVVEMTPRESDLRPGGTVSGPLVMAVADAAIYCAILSRNGGEMAVTSQMSINFLSRPKPSVLRGDAEILKWGKRTVFCEVRIYCGSEKSAVAIVTGSYSLPSLE